MFERITTNIVPPEMAALLLPATTSPKVRGYIFRRHSDGLYHGTNGVVTVLRSNAHIYSRDGMARATRNYWSWGCKGIGTWIIVYE